MKTLSKVYVCELFLFQQIWDKHVRADITPWVNLFNANPMCSRPMPGETYTYLSNSTVCGNIFVTKKRINESFAKLTCSCVVELLSCSHI